MSIYTKAFDQIVRSGGSSRVDGATDTDWESIETVLGEYASSQGSDMKTFFADALDQYVTDAAQSKPEPGYALTFDFQVLNPDPGSFKVTWS